MEKISLRGLYQRGTFTSISRLRYNKNDYPYITLVKGEKSQNLYFGKKSAEVVSNHFKEGSDLIGNGFLKNADIILTKNEKDEARYKVSVPSAESQYATQADMESAFGMQEEQNFNVLDFEAEFSVKADSAVSA